MAKEFRKDPKSEVEIPGSGEEYEVIALSPLRRLEKRLEAVEQTRTVANLERFVDKILDMVELNQKIVDEVVKANQGLREDMAVLVGKMDELYSRIGDFIDIIKSAGEEERAEVVSRETIEATVTPIIAKMEEMNKRVIESNATIADTLGAIEKRLKAVVAPAAPGLLARRPFPTGVPAEA